MDRRSPPLPFLLESSPCLPACSYCSSFCRWRSSALLLWLAADQSLVHPGDGDRDGRRRDVPARSQGWRTCQRIRNELAAGRIPTDSLLDALLILVAGILLLTPGLLTDALGVSLLIPPCRRRFRQRLIRWIGAHFRIHSFAAGDARSGHEQSEVIDGYVVDDSERGRNGRR